MSDNVDNGTANDTASAAEPQDNSNPDANTGGDASDQSSKATLAQKGYDADQKKGDDQNADDDKSTGDNDQKSDDDGDKDDKAKKADDDSDKAKEDQDADEDQDQGAPEEYEDFKLPEGYEVHEEVMGEAKSLFKELDLPQDKAQKLIDLQTKVETARAEVWAEQQKTWAKESAEHPDFGGEKFEANAATANKALVKYGGDAVVELLEQFGLQNHPAMVGMFYNIGKDLKEGGDKSSSGASGGGNKRLADMYDKT